jgi:GNAT superfamily N-acetyltransferase
MATLTPTFAASHQPEGVLFARVSPVRRNEALALLLTGAVGGSRAVVEQFLGFASDQSLSLDHLWGAFRGGPNGAILAACLIVQCSGRTAMTFVSPPQFGVDASVAGGLIRTACAAQDPLRVRVVQGLLDAGQFREADAFASAGFTRLAHLVYMQRVSMPPFEALRIDPAIDILYYQPDLRPLFAQAVLGSYEDTADCPGLLGLREIDDILDGHMATGEFLPHLWMLLRCGDAPVGVLLLNPVLQRQAMEVVYLGLSKPWRGKGLGRRLLLHALGLTRRERIKQVILAVDEANEPAMQLYRSMKFTPTARKLAMVWPVAAHFSGT